MSQPLRTSQIYATHLRMQMSKLGAQYYPKRSNELRHIYYSRRLRRWLAVSNAGNGILTINEYAECPCGATT